MAAWLERRSSVKVSVHPLASNSHFPRDLLQERSFFTGASQSEAEGSHPLRLNYKTTILSGTLHPNKAFMTSPNDNPVQRRALSRRVPAPRRADRLPPSDGSWTAVH